MPERRGAVMELGLEIIGERVLCRMDGREARSAPLADFLRAVVEHSDHLPLPEAIPDGVRLLRRRGEAMALAIEERPQVRTVRWLADDSPVPYGPRAVYRTVRLAFPFIVLVVVLRRGGLTGYQQCFYRAAPVQRLDDPLFFPNLYNVAKGYGQQCWLCLVNLRKNLAPLPWGEKVREIRRHLWGAGFNQSSEAHEGMSYWQAMRQVDARLSSLAAWEEASRRDPLFPLTVPWQPVGQTVGDVMEEMLSAVAPARPPASVPELVHLLNLCTARSSRRTIWPFPLKT
jgi:hypothetical protein